MGNKRSSNYLGPGRDIEVGALRKLEESGRYIAERKKDGMWAECHVGNPAEGRPHIFSSRDADTAPLGNGELVGLDTAQVPWPEGSIVVGELEAKTQWATAEAERKGYRSFHVFDLAAVANKNTKPLSWTQRRELLEMMYRSKADILMSRFPLLDYQRDNFVQLYEASLSDGDEGVVLWKADLSYAAQRSDGKSEHIIRCKQWMTKEYVLIGLGRTPSGVLTGEWGLYIGGKLSRVMQKTCPHEFLRQENIGLLVAEFLGQKLHRSGALRDSRFVRVRTDKPAIQCTL